MYHTCDRNADKKIFFDPANGCYNLPLSSYGNDEEQLGMVPELARGRIDPLFSLWIQ
jgi:hypothetical protein